jgi:hypothetical protein
MLRFNVRIVLAYGDTLRVGQCLLEFGGQLVETHGNSLDRLKGCLNMRERNLNFKEMPAPAGREVDTKRRFGAIWRFFHRSITASSWNKMCGRMNIS